MQRNERLLLLPTLFVIFGITGDLSTRKIIPALFHLFQKKQLPQKFQIIGFSRRDFSTKAYRDFIRTVLKNHAVAPDQKRLLPDFLRLCLYHRGFFEEERDYTGLANVLAGMDAKWRVCTNKLFYLAVPPHFYETMFRHLASSGLTIACSPQEGWTRVLVEKPFGKDLSSARRLDEMLASFFQEEQIYRIDHYLAKEMVQNILTFRFSNNLFETRWDSTLIEKIEISLLETIGVEDRGMFYDGIGALRDVGQNHLLQMLALAIMEHPPVLDAESIRARRAEALNAVKAPLKEEVKLFSFRAQYRGFRQIEGVQSRSETETYFKVRLQLDSPRWRNVPVFLEGGKRLGKIKKEMVVTFTHPRPCLCPPERKEHYKNRIIFSLEPEEKIKIQFWSKKPGLAMVVEERDFDFLFRTKREIKQYIEEYEKLLLDCIVGDQTLFVSTKEVRAMWRVIDPVVRYWQAGAAPLAFYQPDTDLVREKSRLVSSFPVGKKEIAIVGLGKMGTNIARRLFESGWRVIGFDQAKAAVDQLTQEGVETVSALHEAIRKLSPPRLVWLMIPAGEPIEELLFGQGGLHKILEKGDVVIDAGNSFYKDTIQRSMRLARRGISFIDVGVSGGPAGARQGASLMVGGTRSLFKKWEFLFQDLAQPGGYQFFSGVGAGHFVKMVHNGIEYGMMQAMAEGFTLLRQSSYHLNLHDVASVYNHGSVIESRLGKWLENAFALHGENLKGVSGSVAHTREGEWAVRTAQEMGIKTKVIKEALQFRIFSQRNPSYAGKILSALREQFGGHSIKTSFRK